MRVVLQRVREASVTIGGREAGRIARGLLALVGFSPADTLVEVQWMVEKVAGLRIFPDGDGKMNLDVTAIGGAILVVSQFTLYGDVSRGRRPSFVGAAHPDVAVPLYEAMLAALARTAIPVASGEFGADMQVSLVNDGPVTLILERNAE